MLREFQEEIARLKAELVAAGSGGSTLGSSSGSGGGGSCDAAGAVASTASGAAGYVGDVVGSDSLKEWGFDAYKENMKNASQLTLAKSVTDINSTSDLGSWLAENAGYTAFQAAQAILSAGVGAAGCNSGLC